MGMAKANVAGAITHLQVRRILACVDRSTLSEVCVPYAVALAKTFGSAVTLAHVMQPHSEDAGPQPSDALGWEISRLQAQSYLERLQRSASEELGRAVEVRLEQGHPAQRLVGLARELGADVTVLASHGESGVTPWNLGGTAQQVLALAHNSVFIAHSSSVAAPKVALRRIMVALDGSPRAEGVLPAAVRLSGAHGAELLLVHVVHEPVPSALLANADDLALARELAQRLEGAATRYLEHLSAQLTHQGTAVRTCVVRHPNVPQCLLKISQQEQADLVVLSAHGATCDQAHAFGSVTAFLLTHSTVPLLVLQDLPEGDLHRQPDAPPSAPSQPLRASFAPETV